MMRVEHARVRHVSPILYPGESLLHSPGFSSLLHTWDMGRQLTIVPPRLQWPAEFAAIAGRLRNALGSRARRIDHIGSTAVPGLPAKDIIDIQVTVDALDPEDSIVAAMLAAGFTHRSDIRGDHMPPGETAPERWCKLFFNRAHGRAVNVHVRQAGNPNQRYPLLFRDFLRARPEAAAAYAEVKRQLACHCPEDWDAYYDIKDPVCDLIMSGAEIWARESDWSPE